MIRTQNVIRTASFRQESIGFMAGKGLFVVPEWEARRAQRERATMQVGRKQYVWNPMAQDKLYSDALADSYAQRAEDRAKREREEAKRAREAKREAEAAAIAGRRAEREAKRSNKVTVTRVKGAKPAPKPTPAKSIKAAKPARKPALTERERADLALRKVIADATGKPFNGPMTPAIRARARDLAAEREQRRSYVKR